MRLMPSVNFLRDPITKKSLGRFVRFMGPMMLICLSAAIASAYMPRMPYLLPIVIGLSAAFMSQYFFFAGAAA